MQYHVIYYMLGRDIALLMVQICRNEFILLSYIIMCFCCSYIILTYIYLSFSDCIIHVLYVYIYPRCKQIIDLKFVFYNSCHCQWFLNHIFVILVCSLCYELHNLYMYIYIATCNYLM